MPVKVNVEPTNVDKARAAWADGVPEWVRVLAEACDRTSQRVVSTLLGRSAGYVSRVINRSYTGSYEEAEQLVRSRLAADEVICPIWGEPIPFKACMGNRRRKAAPRTQMHHAYARTCPTCPSNRDIEEVRS